MPLSLNIQQQSLGPAPVGVGAPGTIPIPGYIRGRRINYGAEDWTPAIAYHEAVVPLPNLSPLGFYYRAGLQPSRSVRTHPIPAPNFGSDWVGIG